MPAKLKLVKTCSACPEQYDVYQGGIKIGYMRLRHGHFRCENSRGEVVYSSDVVGDGMFADDEERRKHLTLACNVLLMESGPLYEIDEDAS